MPGSLTSKALLDGFVSHVAIIDQTGLIIAVNEAWRTFAETNGLPGCDPHGRTGVGMNYLDVCRSATDADGVGEATTAGLLAVLEGRRERFELDYPCPAPGIPRWFRLRATPIKGMVSPHCLIEHVDITGEKLSTAEVRAQSAILEAVALRRPLPEIFEQICELVEEQLVDAACSILLLDPVTKRLHVAAGHHLPAEYNAAVDGIAIGPSVGSCGTAAFRKQPVDVLDIATDPLWADFRELALSHGLRSCLSIPVFASGNVAGVPRGEVLATFAIYHRTPRTTAVRANDPRSDFGYAAAHLIEVALERDRVEVALRNSQEQLRQSQKLEAIGQLAGGVAHDFNNLLTIIQGDLEILRGTASRSDSDLELFGEIDQACHRASALTRQLLTFSRRAIVELRTIALDDAVEVASRMLRRLIGENIHLELKLGARAFVRVDLGQLEQVLLNLVLNARDAMPDGGPLRISTTTKQLESAQTPTGLAPGRYAVITVSDHGTGIDAAVIDRIFEPFFTTKEVGRGTGLGLATVYGIVRQSEGHVTVESAPGKGTSFHVYLPVAPEPPREIAERVEPVAVATPPAHETILLVEDEPALRRLANRVLAERGYRILAAGDGAEALHLANSYAGAIDLLVTDVVMPELGGGALVAAIRQVRPDLRVLYVSGYTDDEMVRHGIAVSEVPFLAKPFTSNMLARRVREVLDAPPGVDSARV